MKEKRNKAITIMNPWHVLKKTVNMNMCMYWTNKTLNLLFVEKHRGFAFVEFELAEVCWIFDVSVVEIVTNRISVLNYNRLSLNTL